MERDKQEQERLERYLSIYHKYMWITLDKYIWCDPHVIGIPIQESDREWRVICEVGERDLSMYTRYMWILYDTLYLEKITPKFDLMYHEYIFVEHILCQLYMLGWINLKSLTSILTISL